jgi:microcystin-dependent protein
VYQQTSGLPGATLWIKETGVATNTGWNASGTTSGGLVLGGGQCPTGTIVEYSSSVLPGGWLWCDGAAQLRATYSALDALYSADGYPWGAGNGTTTFNTPDKRGVVTAGDQAFGGNGTTLFADRLLGLGSGNVVGNKTKALGLSELPVHNHAVTDPTHSQFVAGGGSGPVAVTATTTVNQAPSTPSGTGIVIQNAGSGTAFNLIQPTMLSRFIVKI